MNVTRTLRNKKNKTYNNILKNSKTKKNRKTYLILQYDNRIIPKNYEILININKKYCSLYGYSYILDTKEYNLPPYWIKVMLVNNLLKTNKYKGILWLDTDAVINDFSISLDSIYCNNKSIYYSYEIIERDLPYTKKLKTTYGFNAGVWLILNDKIGKEIISDWINLYDKDKWIFKNNKWKCNSCKWAGVYYEQGSFEKYIIPKYKNYCKQYKLSFFQSSNIHQVNIYDEKFVYHFYGCYKKELENYLISKKFTIKSVNN